MKFLASFVLIFPLLLDSAFADLASGAAVADSWVVTLKNTVGASSSSVDSHYDWLNDILGASTGSVADGKKPGITYKYSIPNFNGYAGVFSKDVLEQIKKRSDVESVHQDEMVTTHAPSPSPADVYSNKPCITQPLNQMLSFGEWGLGRISHATKYPTLNYGWPTYNYDEYSLFCPIVNPGGTAYVIDSGIQVTHPEFEGRAEFGFNANPGVWKDTDICGHGTHVAGIIAGKRYGVKKNARVIAVKVLEGALQSLSCGGAWSQVMAGIDWSYKDAIEKGIIKQSVINMSLGGGVYKPLNDMLQLAITGGMTAVVSAGNSRSDACFQSPASLPAAITVGSSDINDMVSTFSNVGCCVDIYAPGTNIAAAWIGGGNIVISGTSMASPMVAGMVLYNKCRHGYTTPLTDRYGIVNSQYSIDNALSPFTSCEGTNKLVYNRNNCKV